jgi:hypothetical protein
MGSSEWQQHPALLERKDGTLVAWYCCVYAPRTGGAYDSQHRTAGRRRRGRSRRTTRRIGALIAFAKDDLPACQTILNGIGNLLADHC